MRTLFKLLLLLAAFQSEAATRWITLTGSGNFDGTSLGDACSYQSASAACFSAANVPTAVAGDTYCFSGDFTGFVLNSNLAGTAGNYITFNFAGTGVCTGATPATLTRTAGSQLFLIDVDYLKIVGGTWGPVQSGSNYIFNLQPGADGTYIDGATFLGNVGGATYWGILGNLNNGATNINGLTVINSTFSGFINPGYEPIRLVPLNSSSDCSSTGYFAGISITYSAFYNNVVAVRAVPLVTGAPNFGTCVYSLPKGFTFAHNIVDGTVSQGINFSCTSDAGYPCYIGYNEFTNNGNGTSDTYNTIQTTKSDYFIIEFNTIDGARDLGGSGDGVGIIADMGGASTSYKSQYGVIRGNLVKNVNSNANACGIEIWRADYVQVYGNVLLNNLNGICVANSGITGSKVFNNVVLGDSSSVVNYKFYVNASATDFYNNVSVGGRYSVSVESGSTAPTDGNNDYYGATTGIVSGSYTPAASTLNSDPQFVGGAAPTTKDGFKLLLTSPLLRAGKDLNIGTYQDAEGRGFMHPPSIGAYERASGDVR